MPSTDYHFVTHDEWKPVDNCTTSHCMLLQGAPLHSWTSVGNGSYKGARHDLQFLNTGKSLTYSATRIQSLNKNNNTISNTNEVFKRGRGTYRAGFTQQPHRMQITNFGSPRVPIYNSLPDIGSIGAMEGALKNYPVNCIKIIYNSTAAINAVTGGVILDGVMDTSTDILTSEMADNRVSACAAQEAKAEPFIVWPVDGTDIDVLSALLASYPDANVVEHISLNGWGMLYWEADLTTAQMVDVSCLLQV